MERYIAALIESTSWALNASRKPSSIVVALRAGHGCVSSSAMRGSWTDRHTAALWPLSDNAVALRI
jgi:hypothetical protein